VKVKLAAALATTASPTRNQQPCSDEEDGGYATPDDWEEPARNRHTNDFLDRDYESRVREQQYAIKKAIPHWIGHKIKKTVKTQADQDRLYNKYREIMERVFAEHDKTNSALDAMDSDFDKWIRCLAESQVRWGATPNQALEIMTRTVGIDECHKAEFISVMDKTTSRKNNKKRRG